MAIDFPAGPPNIPDAQNERLPVMHGATVGHVSATNRILTNIRNFAAKLGYGTSPPGTNGVLRARGGGNTNWGPVEAQDLDPGIGSATVMLLDYKEATDLYGASGGATWPANTGMAFSGQKTFTVQSATSIVEIAIRVGVFNTSAPAAACQVQSYFILDGTYYRLGSCGSNAYSNPFAGAQPVFLTGLAAGVHTIQVFAWGNGTTNGWYCRCASQPTLEHFTLQVLEHKMGVGIPGPVGPSAQTAGGTKQQLVDTQTADVSGLSLPVGAWTTLRGPLTFTVDDSSSLIEISIAANTLATNTGGSASVFSTRILIDGAISRIVGGAIPTANGANYFNGFQGVEAWFTGLSAGSHTITCQIQAVSYVGTYYCRPATQPEGFVVTVNEHKQGGLSWVYRGAWSSTINYSMRDVVTYQGSSYVAVQGGLNQNPSTATAYWGLMASKGDTGAAGTNGTNGTSIIWRGAYSAATAYVVQDVVVDGGVTYIAIAASTGQTPASSPTFWSVMVAPGSMTNPMTTADDVIKGGTSGVPTRLAKGPVNTVLGVDASGNLIYRQVTGSDIATSSALSVASIVASGGINAASVVASGGIQAGTSLTTQLGVSGAYFNGGNVGQGDLRAYIIRAGGGGLTSDGGTVSAGRVTCNVAGDFAAIYTPGSGSGMYSPSGTLRSDISGTAFHAPNGDVVIGRNGSIGGTFSVGSNLTVGGQVQASAALAFYAPAGNGYIQVNGNQYYALYAPYGGMACAGQVAGGTLSISAGATVGQFHINNTTVYGGGNATNAVAFFYITINGVGYKCPLYS